MQQERFPSDLKFFDYDINQLAKRADNNSQ